LALEIPEAPKSSGRIVDVGVSVWESPEQLGEGAAANVRHRWRDPWKRPDAAAGALDAAMEPVRHALILGMVSDRIGARVTIEDVAQTVTRQPGKYLGVAGIDPTRDDTPERVEQAREAGMVGVTVSPAAQGFHPAHSNAMKLYQRCVDLNWPLIVQPLASIAPQAAMEFAAPLLLDEVAREFPELKIVIAQMGEPHPHQTLAMIAKHPNVFAGIGGIIGNPWALYDVVVRAHHHDLLHKVLFASGFPFCTPERAIVTLYSINSMVAGTHLPNVPREQLRSIVEGNALERLGISAESGDAPAAATPPESPADADTNTNPDADGDGEDPAGATADTAEHNDTDDQPPAEPDDADADTADEPAPSEQRR